MILGLFAISEPASAMKYLTMKEAIKNFLPKGSKLSKVTKTVPAGKIPALKKRFKLEPVKGEEFKEKFPAGPYDIYIGRDKAGKAEVYIMVLDQYWRTCYHKYAVALDGSGKIKEMVVMEFNCRYQYPINKKSFLNQFKGKTAGNMGTKIDVVTGSTRSCEATAIVARRALALYDFFFASGAN
jgi:hypothetical protein